MDFGGIIKKAWNVTWRYKVLWIFGFFAGAAGGGSGGGGSSNYSTSSEEFADPQQFDKFSQWISDNVVLIIAIVTILIVIGIALWILSVAARGGLIHLVNEAEEGRPVRAGDGWGVGFSKWGRVFLVDFVLYLPLFIVVVVMLVVAFVPLIAAAGSGGDPTAGIFSMCGGLAFGGLILLVLGFVVGLLEAVAIRRAVLEDTPAMASISGAWSDLKARFKDLFVMWLVMLAVGLGYGVVIGILAAIFGVAIAFALVGGLWPLAAGIGFVLFLALIVPQAVFGTFSSAAWTIFYRKMTGRDVGVAAQPPLQGQEGYASLVPPPPPAPMTPPAPPAPPAPAAPDTMPPPPPAPPQI